MRRDQFAATVRETADGPPVLQITYDGPDVSLDRRLKPSGEQPEPSDIDAAFRLFAPLEDVDDPEGVFSLTQRLTGEYLLEVNADTSEVLDAVDAARDVDGDPSYRVVVKSNSGEAVLELETLLVYNNDGDLLRQQSLIPSGVEL